MIDRAGAPDAAGAQANRQARRFAVGPTEAYGVTKRLLAATCERDFAAETDVEGREIARLSGRADAAEGIAAFRAKPKAVFQG